MREDLPLNSDHGLLVIIAQTAIAEALNCQSLVNESWSVRDNREKGGPRLVCRARKGLGMDIHLHKSSIKTGA